MAVKTFRKDRRKDFDRENTALTRLEDEENLVKRIGDFIIFDQTDGVDNSSFNILMEFGNWDLEQWFADPTTTPPTGPEEIIYFWEELFKVCLRSANSLVNVPTNAYQVAKGLKATHKGPSAKETEKEPDAAATITG